MTKIINIFLSFLKVLLLLICFVLCFFIIFSMYQRLEKDYVDAIFNFIPFVLLFILFSINFIFKQKTVNSCLFYNVTCCFVFIVILFAAYRTFFDPNMVVMIRLGYNINFNYFADFIAPMRAMLYILCAANVLLMIIGLFDKKKVVTESKIVVEKEEVKEVEEKVEKKDTPKKTVKTRKKVETKEA